MDVSEILDCLNTDQREAVSSNAKSLLVLAGAGSGKTRVLVHRIAWMLQVEGLSPHSIMAVTFTNKAAAEMRVRIEKLIGCGNNYGCSLPVTVIAEDKSDSKDQQSEQNADRKM